MFCRPPASASVHTLTGRLAGYAWGLCTPVLCTLIAWPLRLVLGEGSILMIYMLGVFLVASRYGCGASITSALLSAPAFAFYFASPIFSFAISDIENSVGLGIMIVVASLTSNLLDRYRTQAALAQQRENRSSALYRLSQALADAGEESAVASVAVAHIYQEFHVRSVLLPCNTEGRFIHPAQPPQAHSLTGLDAAAWSNPDSQRVLCHSLDFATTHRMLLVMEQAELELTDRDKQVFFETFLSLIRQALERLALAEQAREALFKVETEALRNALLSAISHDLRTPLTRIHGAALTCLEAGLSLSDSENQDLARLILEESQRMSDLTSKILDMARLSSGEITLHQDWNAIEEIVGSALTRLDSRLQNRPVRTWIPEQLPLVWVDAVLIQQVLVNLIENAIKYTPLASPIDIGASADPEWIQLTVTDYGPGIPEGMEERLFEKFFRLETECHQSGVGLGLALCRLIIRAHGGDIVARNLKGKGLIVSMRLPFSVAPRFDAMAIGE